MRPIITYAPTFWVTNFSNRNVSLSDLNLTIKAFTSVNLLDVKHYQYTSQQLVKSAESGSIFKKRNMLIVRKIAPEVFKANIKITRETFMPSRERSILSIKDGVYEELHMIDETLSPEDLKKSDEQFAKDNADTAEMDQKPLVIKG